MIRSLLAEIEGQNATLVAVSKTKSPDQILAVYEQGIRDFGENRVQELITKYEQLPRDIRWHMVGHLQSKKVKQIAPFVQLIHSVDSHKLLEEISKQGLRNDRVIDVLLQIKIGMEESKYGIEPTDIDSFLGTAAAFDLPNVRIRGFMGMASFVTDHEQIRKEFQLMKLCFEKMKSAYFQEISHFDIISMGMSGDYKIALEEGSTMVRVGTLIFGARS